MRYEAGDKVIVVESPVDCVFGWVPTMTPFCGRVVTIKEAIYEFNDEPIYYFAEDYKYEHSWCNRCIAGYAEPEETATISDIEDIL